MNIGAPELGFIGLLLLILFGSKKLTSGTKNTIAKKSTSTSVDTNSEADYQNKNKENPLASESKSNITPET